MIPHRKKLPNKFFCLIYFQGKSSYSLGENSKKGLPEGLEFYAKKSSQEENTLYQDWQKLNRYSSFNPAPRRFDFQAEKSPLVEVNLEWS